MESLEALQKSFWSKKWKILGLVFGLLYGVRSLTFFYIIFYQKYVLIII